MKISSKIFIRYGTSRYGITLILLLLVAFQFSCGYEPYEFDSDQPDYEPFCRSSELTVGRAETSDIFWFVQISDIEQTRLSGAELFSFSIVKRSDYRTFLNQLRYIRNVVNPSFVVATGDLVFGGVLEQVSEQWLDYRNAVMGACFNETNYHDIPGNHDVLYVENYNHFLEYSISGTRHQSWTVETPLGRFAFVGFDTTRPGEHAGFFDEDEKQWLEKTLDQYADHDYRLVFAHHNLPWNKSVSLYADDGALRQGNVNGFLAGHVHKDGEQYRDGIVNIQTDAIYKTNDPGAVDGKFRIIAFDGLNFSSAPKWIFHHGPQVLITSPQDIDYSTAANPEGHIVSGITPIRALAFANDKELTLVAYIDNEGPIPMENIEDNLFETEIDFDEFPPGQHNIRVRAMGYSDNLNPVDRINVVSQ